MPMNGTETFPIVYFDEQGVGPQFHVCLGTAVVAAWLDRQIFCGLITPEGAKAVERLIEDLR